MLVTELFRIGVRGGRRQAVRLKHVTSELLSVHSGVPQRKVGANYFSDHYL